VVDENWKKRGRLAYDAPVVQLVAPHGLALLKKRRRRRTLRGPVLLPDIWAIAFPTGTVHGESWMCSPDLGRETAIIFHARSGGRRREHGTVSDGFRPTGWLTLAPTLSVRNHRQYTSRGPAPACSQFLVVPDVAVRPRAGAGSWISSRSPGAFGRSSLFPGRTCCSGLWCSIPRWGEVSPKFKISNHKQSSKHRFQNHK